MNTTVHNGSVSKQRHTRAIHRSWYVSFYFQLVFCLDYCVCIAVIQLTSKHPQATNALTLRRLALELLNLFEIFRRQYPLAIHPLICWYTQLIDRPAFGKVTGRSEGGGGKDEYSTTGWGVPVFSSWSTLFQSTQS